MVTPNPKPTDTTPMHIPPRTVAHKKHNTTQHNTTQHNHNHKQQKTTRDKTGFTSVPVVANDTACQHHLPHQALLLALSYHLQHNNNNKMSSSFGELVLVLGDLHIPHRATAIPPAFQRMLVPNKMQHVLCTGNLISPHMLAELQALAPQVHVVRGDMDDAQVLNFPETKVITVGAFRIGLVHGHQIVPYHSPDAVARMRRKLNVDILITGHTHQSEVSVQDGPCYHINPVS
jgi:vacuolar protein sorting-associated protein 29